MSGYFAFEKANQSSQGAMPSQSQKGQHEDRLHQNEECQPSHLYDTPIRIL